MSRPGRGDPTRRCVVGLRLQLPQGEAFVARRCPDAGAASSEDCFVELGTTVAIPAFEALRQTTNSAGLTALMTTWCGIGDNVHEPPAGQTRPALAANIRHALAYCFQPQDEIIRRDQLFHGSGDTFFAQALKDTLPYFLGAVDDDYIRKRERLRQVRDQLRSVERRLAELASLRGTGATKASALVAQARDAGLTDAVANTWEDAITSLRGVASTPVEDGEQSSRGGDEFARLSDERSNLLVRQRWLRDEIAATRAFEQEEKGFSAEASEQKARLKSIGISGGSTPGTSCPLCARDSKATPELPSTTQLQTALSSVSSRLEAVARGAPRVEKAVAELEGKLAEVQAAMAKNRTEMDAVRLVDKQLRDGEESAVRRAHVLGRVSLYLESVPDFPDTRALVLEAKRLREEYAALAEELSDERVRERLESIASILGQQMTQWARELHLEHSAALLRFDFRKLRIVADTADGPVPMD